MITSRAAYLPSYRQKSLPIQLFKETDNKSRIRGNPRDRNNSSISHSIGEDIDSDGESKFPTILVVHKHRYIKKVYPFIDYYIRSSSVVAPFHVDHHKQVVNGGINGTSLKLALDSCTLITLEPVHDHHGKTN